MSFNLDEVDMFPKPTEENHPKSGMPVKEFSMLELGLTRMAAAASLAGDIEMGRALAKAITPLIEFHMSRWPTVNVDAEVSALNEDTNSPDPNEPELPGVNETQAQERKTDMNSENNKPEDTDSEQKQEQADQAARESGLQQSENAAENGIAADSNSEKSDSPQDNSGSSD